MSTVLDTAARANASEIVRMDACALSQAIRTKAVSCVEVMRAYLDQIDRLNPVVNAIISRQDPDDLLRQARGRDDELARGQWRGWMHGFPQAIKDLAATAGITTTLGSPLFKDNVPALDAIFVERMKAAGSIISAKPIRPIRPRLASYNPVFGTTLNAFDQTRTSGGSSGGAAVALALRMLPVADGSDHAGSLRNPAAFNNVYGLRPSYGRVPSNTEEVFLPQLGVAGPMARTVSDLAQLLAVQAGYDPRVPLSIREGAQAFASPLTGAVAGPAPRVAGRSRGPSFDGVRGAPPVRERVERVRGSRLHGRSGDARLRSRADLAGLARAATMAGRGQSGGALR
jgi:amidase